MIGGTSASSVDVTLTPEMLSEGQSSSRLGYITLCVRVSAVTVIVTRRPGAKTYLAASIYGNVRTERMVSYCYLRVRYCLSICIAYVALAII